MKKQNSTAKRFIARTEPVVNRPETEQKQTRSKREQKQNIKRAEAEQKHEKIKQKDMTEN